MSQSEAIDVLNIQSALRPVLMSNQTVQKDALRSMSFLSRRFVTDSYLTDELLCKPVVGETYTAEFTYVESSGDGGNDVLRPCFETGGDRDDCEESERELAVDIGQCQRLELPRLGISSRQSNKESCNRCFQYI